MATSDDFLLDFVGMSHLMKVQLVVTSLLFFVRTEVLRVFFYRKIATFTRTRDPNNTTAVPNRHYHVWPVLGHLG